MSGMAVEVSLPVTGITSVGVGVAAGPQALSTKTALNKMNMETDKFLRIFSISL